MKKKKIKKEERKEGRERAIVQGQNLCNNGYKMQELQRQHRRFVPVSTINAQIDLSFTTTNGTRITTSTSLIRSKRHDSLAKTLVVLGETARRWVEKPSNHRKEAFDCGRWVGNKRRSRYRRGTSRDRKLCEKSWFATGLRRRLSSVQQICFGLSTMFEIEGILNSHHRVDPQKLRATSAQ